MNSEKQLYATHSDQIKIYFNTLLRNFWYEKRWGVLISAIIIPLLLTIVAGKEVFGHSADTLKGAFAFVCASLWIGLFNSVQKICKERASVDAEYRSGQSMGAYVVAQMIFEFVLCLIEMVILSIIIILNYANNTSLGNWIQIIVTLFLVIYSADILGLLISAIVKNAEQSMTIMPFVLILQLVFAGCIFELEGLASLISKFTISKWGYEAILSICELPYSESRNPVSFILCWVCIIFAIAMTGLMTERVMKYIHYDHR